MCISHSNFSAVADCTLTAGDALDDLLDAVDGVGEVEVAHEGEREGVEKAATARLGKAVVVLGTASLLLLRSHDDVIEIRSVVDGTRL